MCRLLGYLGPTLSLETLLLKPEHSLVVQSYQPREMEVALLNADGFGWGWYHPHKPVEPFIYRNTLPIWNDGNVSPLSRYIESSCVLAHVRSATAGQAIQLSNCQPFRYNQLLGMHNGYIKEFRQTLYRPIRDSLSDACYQLIEGTTDSEHIFSLVCHEWESTPNCTLKQALETALLKLEKWAMSYQVAVAVNVILSDGQQLVASRFAVNCHPPSLYWLQDDPSFARGVVIASEPMVTSDRWNRCSENSLLVVGETLDIQTYQL